jgi:hypothetical protein
VLPRGRRSGSIGPIASEAVEQAIDKSDLRLLRLMTKRVGVALRGQRERALSAAIRDWGNICFGRLLADCFLAQWFHIGRVGGWIWHSLNG